MVPTTAPKKYASLAKRYKTQPPEQIFAHFSFDRERGENWETPYYHLQRMAKDEDWNFHRDQFKATGQTYPILTSYLNYTFLRLQELNRIKYSTDEMRACFNTGLQTPNEKDIFATFRRNRFAREGKGPDWILFGFFDSYSDRLADFKPLPEIASYIEDPADLVCDTSYTFEVNYDHIFEDNRERLPDVLKDNRTLAISAIQGSVELLKQKIIRNYKIAIPHWYDSKLQLLLPLNLTSAHEADLALVADKDKERRIYRVRTVLTMDMAYVDARLITRPDREWLNP